MAEYLHFVCVPHGKKLLTKSSAVKEAPKGMFAFQQPYTHFLLQQWLLHTHGPDSCPTQIPQETNNAASVGEGNAGF